MNPTPTDVRDRVLSLAIDEADDTASLGVALGLARQFGLKSAGAKDIVREVGAAVAKWRESATALGLSGRDQTRMASAFEHDDLAISQTI